MACPFHLAFPVRNLDETRRSYEGEFRMLITLGRIWVALGLLSARHQADQVSGR